MVVDAVIIETKERAGQKRQATEAAIISAFEAVLERDGARSVGVNNVVKEAGIGKGLLYKYFGGLPGLVRAWAQKRRLWPNFEGILEKAENIDIDPVEAMKEMLFTHANTLRDRPVALEILAEELLSPSILTEAFAQTRVEFGKEYFAAFDSIRGLREPMNRSLIIVLSAAANYLAMRTRSAPNYMGLDLDTEEGWNEILSAMDQIVEKAGQPIPERVDSDTTAADTLSSQHKLQ